MTNQASWLGKLLGPDFVGGPPITSIEMIPARREALNIDSLNTRLPDLADHHADVVLRVRDGHTLTCEVYVPHGGGPFPPVLYMHGGAWCVWHARDVRRIAMQIASAGFVVFNLDYGLAPEHAYPWAVEDAIYAARWIAETGARYGASDSPLTIGGDSAGANLACAAIAFLNGLSADIDEGDLAGIDVRFAASLLFYGVYDFRARLDWRDTTPGTTEVMANQAYLGSHFLAKHKDPLVSPIYAPNLDQFPPAYLSVGCQDAVLPDSLAMTARFAEVGVPARLSVVPDCDHEYLLLDPSTPVVASEWERIFQWLTTQTS